MTPRDAAEAQTDPITPADVGVIAIVHLLTEMNVRAGADPDGSHTIGRLLILLGGYEQLGRVVAAHGMPWDAAADGAGRELRRRLRLAEPVVSRLALPPTLMRPPFRAAAR